MGRGAKIRWKTRPSEKKGPRKVSGWIIQEIVMLRIMTEVMLYSFTEPAAKIKEWWWGE